MNKIDISTEEKKQEVYKIFDSLENKNQIHKYYKISDNTQGSEYIKQIANEIGFDFNIYKERKRKFCLHCGKEIVGKGKSSKKFCNSSCAASYNNKIRKDNSQKYFCINCGKEVNSKRQKYCSFECEHEYHYNEYIKKWKDGEEDGLRGEYGLSKFIRKYLLLKNNYKCELCNWGEINTHTNSIPLEIYHIDGNYQNNKEDNLQVLCPNCHSLTSTHKSHNQKGNGRKGRDKYYK